jgi:hypothetical protein
MIVPMSTEHDTVADIADKLYVCLRFLRSSRQRSSRARWYVLASDGSFSSGPLHAAELAYRIYYGLVDASETAVDCKTGAHHPVASSELLARWLVQSEEQSKRIVRGLLQCVRHYIVDGRLPIELNLPSWAEELLTPAEQHAFQVLSLPPTCSPREARKRHRELVITHHPDRGGSEDRMKEINRAYEVVQKVAGF